MKDKKLPQVLPPKEIPFSIDMVGSRTGSKYEGNFVVKIPTVKDMSRIGLELAKLNGGVRFEDLDRNTAVLNNAIAYLRVLLIDSPKWFVDVNEGDCGLNMLDVDVVGAIFSQAEEKISEWYEIIRVGK